MDIINNSATGGESPYGDTTEIAKMFKHALRNMTYNQRRQVVRSSAVYE